MKLQPFQKRTWANIDLDAAEYNYSVIRNRLKPETKLCCVVKANGYGHGAVPLSRLYEQLGADFLAVSNVEEAIQIRSAEVSIPILILGYTDPQCAAELAAHRITQCVFSYEYGNALSRYAEEQGVEVNIHIKLDTGMGRIGFQCTPEELDQAAGVCTLPGLHPEGIFTHFASADEGDGGKEYTLQQFHQFMNSISYLAGKGVHFSIRHCSNSAGIFDYPETHLDMVRAGIVLYGLQPSGELQNSVKLRPVMTLNTIIDHIKTIHPGDCISYGREYRADHEMRVATIPIGYADGLWRSNFRNRMVVEVEGKPAPVIGRICMDQCMIDVTDNLDAKVNSEVIVYGTDGETFVNRIAEANGTINYEIVCALGERVPRVYKKDGKTIAIVDNIL